MKGCSISSFKKLALDWLQLKGKPALDRLDSPEATEFHRSVIASKPFLKRLYDSNYRDVLSLRSSSPEGPSIEIGSGFGLIKEHDANLVTSDICFMPGLDVVFDATHLPFAPNSINSFVLTNSLHHLSDVESFLGEAARCLMPGGRICILDSANTPWSRFVLKNFHHEPFDETAGWKIESGGRLTHANQALSWIVFSRDRARFEKLFPSLKIRSSHSYQSFRYVASGGFSIRQLVPDFFYLPLALLEKILCLGPLSRIFGFYQLIEIERKAL